MDLSPRCSASRRTRGARHRRRVAINNVPRRTRAGWGVDPLSPKSCPVVVGTIKAVFFLHATHCVHARKKKRRFRGEYRSVCLSHVREPEGAGVCRAFPEAVHARKSWEEPGIGGSAARGGRKEEPSPPAFWSQLASPAQGRSEESLPPMNRLGRTYRKDAARRTMIQETQHDLSPLPRLTVVVGDGAARGGCLQEDRRESGLAAPRRA
jgi:hypothetical protein